MTYTINAGSIVGTGQVLIPGGTKNFQVFVYSGMAYLNGAQILPGSPFGIACPDPQLILRPGSPMALGATGVNTLVSYYFTS